MAKKYYFGATSKERDTYNHWIEKNRNLLKIALYWESSITSKDYGREDRYAQAVSNFQHMCRDSRRNSFSLIELKDLISIIQIAAYYEEDISHHSPILLIRYMYSLVERYIRLYEHEQGMKNLLKSTDWVFNEDNRISIDDYTPLKKIYIPLLEPLQRYKDYESFDNDIRAEIVYEFLFNPKTYSWVYDNLTGLNPSDTRGVLSHIGLRRKHQGMFEGYSIQESINILERKPNDYGVILECLKRISEIRVENLNEYTQSDIESDMEITKIGKSLGEIPGIRLLPMADSDPEFTEQSIQEVQEWFKKELPYRDFNYTKGLNAERGTLVLFQYKAHVVASAILEEKIVFNKKLDAVYRGAYRFIPSSIAVFNPINSLDMKEVWDDFAGFNLVQQKLDIDKYLVFWDLLISKQLKYVIEETNEESFQDTIEKTLLSSPFIIKDVPKDPIIIPFRGQSQRWVRNSDTSKRAIMDANYMCGFEETHLSFTSNTTGRNYVEAHHLIPMEFQVEFKKSLDVEANIIPLCPLCHKAVHHASFEEKEPIIRALYMARKDRLQNCEIGIDYKDLISYYD